MDFLVLGPVEVWSADGPVRVGGVRQRSILALLIANRSHVLSADWIVDEVYGEDAVAGARRSVQSIISMLRRDLGDAIVGGSDGYQFDAPREAVDVCRFEDGVTAGLDAFGDDPVRAARLLSGALALWRGDPYGGVDGRGAFEVEAARLLELRAVALEARIEADLMCGQHREVVPELEALVAEYPLRERLWALWMLGLYRSGRQADALAVYQRLRSVLGEGLGLEPSEEVRRLEEQILLHDGALDLVSAVAHNLPAQLTSFVGRDLELIEIGELLDRTRLVTLTGAGGSGKTRLAVEFGFRAIDSYPDGVWFVDLRGTEATGVASVIASTLRLAAAGDVAVVDQLIDALWTQYLLLVLDNCEHVLGGVAPLVERLLRRDGPVRVMATSREPLGVPGESIVPVRALPLPKEGEVVEPVGSEAVALFVDRARNAHSGFVLDDHVFSVFEICQAVEGLPLALELAAARLVMFSPEELAGRLDDQLGTLEAPQRAGDLRHATIEATIRWSWDLIDDNERTLLSRLSVFNGTWTLDIAENVCGFDPIDTGQAMDLVASLVAKSLVVVDGVFAGSTRYRLLEPIRQFAARGIDGSATDRLRGRCIDYWSLASEASHDPTSRLGVRNYERTEALIADRANLTAAIGWALSSNRFEDAMVIFDSSFGDLLLMQGSASELTSPWMETTLAHRERVSRGVLLGALSMVCSITRSDWRMQDCVSYAELAIEMSRTSEERHWFELFVAVAKNRSHRQDEAERMFDQIVAESDDPAVQASALLAKSQFAPPRQAWALSEEAMELSPIESLGWWYEGHAAWLIGEVAAGVGRYDMAIEMEERSVELSRTSNWLILECTSAAVLSWLYAITGRFDEAAALAGDVVPLVRRIAGFHSIADGFLTRAADIARLQGKLSMARGYVAEVEQIAKRPNHPYADRVAASAIYEAALIARDDHDTEYAEELLDGLAESLDAYGQASDPATAVQVRLARASVELTRGNPGGALQDLRAILVEHEQLFHSDALEAVDLTAIALAQQDKAEQAARLKGAIDRERDNCGLVIYPPDALLREKAMSYTQSILEDDWEAAVSHGRTMTLEEATGLARTEADAGWEPQAGTRQADNGTASA